MGKTGLVAEGGGMRGIYAAGILDVLGEHGISFDGLIGVSAGSVHVLSFAAGQHGRNIRYYKKYCADPRFVSFRNLIRTGDIADEQFCYHDLPEKLDPFDYEAFDRAGIPVWCVCTNLETGGPEYLQITDARTQIDILRAGASLPFCSRPVEWEGMKLLDGGCSDSIPVQAFRRMGYDKNVVILTQAEGYVKKAQNPLMVRAAYHKYPNFCRTLERRHTMYNKTLYEIRQLEQEGKVFVFRPSQDPDIARLAKDPKELDRVYRMGRRNAEAKLEQLREFLFLY